MTTLAGVGLTKRYGDHEVVRSIYLEVHPAEVVGLLGPNGAGKTTTFNMFAGGVRPSGGQVFLGETEITDLPMYRRARLGITYLPAGTLDIQEAFRRGQRERHPRDGRDATGPCGASACASFWPSSV